MSRSGETPQLALWERFCSIHQVLQLSVPLFERDADLRVPSSPYGRDQRLILRRSAAMESLYVHLGDRVLRAFHEGRHDVEGILYMMFRPGGWDDTYVVPLYIGRTGMFGVKGGLSANLAAIRSDRGKFGRWGSNYAYHIGDLSAVACPGHPESKRSLKYQRWAERLFVDAPSETPTLRTDTRFWATVWDSGSQSIWQEFGHTSLAFEEYLLIGVSSVLFPDDLLNDEGVNRRARVE